MGLGLLYGSPLTYLSPDWYATGDQLATWIEKEIPSFVGNVPATYLDALFAVFRKHHVPTRIIQEAFSKLAKRGVWFDWGATGMGFHRGFVAPPPISRNGAPSAPQMRAVSKGETHRIKTHTIEEYERRYVLAIKTNDTAGAEAIIAAVLQLLWQWAKGYAKMKQAARNEKMVEWEEFDRAVDEALARARTLRTHIRYLSQEELKSLRDAPTPTELRNRTIRLASRVTTKSVPRSQRVRR